MQGRDTYSAQAPFRIPTAVSLGILVATFLLMLLVPALVMLQERSLALLRYAFGKKLRPPLATASHRWASRTCLRRRWGQ